MWTRVTWIALALTLLVLAGGLPAETFFVGDQGVKLVAARAALEHPATPFDIPLPAIGSERVGFVEPFFSVHGDHRHAMTSETFPVLTAPFIAAFGRRGVFVLPICGFLLTIWSAARLTRAIASQPLSPLLLLGVAFSTPLLFYGLEFWEHTPAVGLAMLATTIFLGVLRPIRDVRGSALACGLLYGAAILLRPEAGWFLLAVVVSSRLLPSPPSIGTLGFVLAGIAVAVGPLAGYSLVHFGTISPPHLGSQTELLTQNWATTRAQVVSAWFVPSALQTTPLWGCALVAMTILGFAATGTASNTRFLAAIVLVDVVLVVLTAPNDGGGQWGPRYLLFAFVPASVLSASALQTFGSRTVAGTLAVAVIVAACAWVQRAGYRELRGTKIIYGTVLTLVRQQVPVGGYAVTDLWWLDQVAATATSDRTILFTPGEVDRRDALRRLHRAGESTVTAFISREESPDVNAWSHLPCYEAAGQTTIETRGLVAISLRRLPACDE